MITQVIPVIKFDVHNPIHLAEAKYWLLGEGARTVKDSKFELEVGFQTVPEMMQRKILEEALSGVSS
jgi:hypothetical protein